MVGYYGYLSVICGLVLCFQVLAGCGLALVVGDNLVYLGCGLLCRSCLGWAGGFIVFNSVERLLFLVVCFCLLVAGVLVVD